jgi:hypothetical protein
MWRMLVLGFFFFLIVPVTAQQTAAAEAKIYDVQALQRDFKVWRHRLETHHPMLYFYRSKADVDQMLDEVAASINHPMTELEFFHLLSPLLPLLQDGHNTIIPSEATVESFRQDTALFPFDCMVLDGSVYVIRNLSDDSIIHEGAHLLSVNGIPADSLLKVFLRNLPIEAFNNQLALSSINENFRFYYHLYFGFSETYTMRVLYQNNMNEIEVTGQPLDTIRSIKKSKYGVHEQAAAIELTTIDSLKTAVLRISTFGKQDLKNTYKQRFNPEIKTIMSTVQDAGVEHLIIDVRDNSGGNPDYVNTLLKYLMPQPFTQAIAYRVVTRPGEEAFMRRTSKRFIPANGMGEFSPKQQVYTGKVYVLMNGGSFSASVSLIGVLKKYDRAILIGSETGGNPVVHSGYLLRTTWKLPHTKIRCSPPKLCSVYDDLAANSGRGAMPDIPIEQNIETVLSPEDEALLVTLEMIRRSK